MSFSRWLAPCLVVSALAVGSWSCGGNTAASGDDNNNNTSGLALGAACAAATECTSGICVATPDGSQSVCSECDPAAACADVTQVCTWIPTSGVPPHFACVGSDSAALGESCSEGGDCVSGYCFDPPGPDGAACSECDAAAPCVSPQTCTYDAAAGYGRCAGTAGLGESCANGSECTSGFCNATFCSECEGNDDCAGGTCVDDTAGVGWYVCSGGLGNTCIDSTECASGFCFDAGGNGQICSLCALVGDCDVQQECAFDPDSDYAVCVGTGVLGEGCDSGGQCASGFCNTTVCSECEGNPDCPNGGACVDDTAGVGWFVCSGGLGDNCAEATECGSGFCYDAQVCSLCALNGDCDVQQECALDPDLDYATCAGTGDLGDACDHGGQCVSGFCNGAVCSECAVDLDCGEGSTCVDDTAGLGYFVCAGALGADCASGIECTSGFCYDATVFMVCSECAVTGDCGVQRVCDFSFADGYAACVGTGALGDGCDTSDQCEPDTVCNTSGGAGVCSTCLASDECTGGGSCSLDPVDAYYRCAGGLGDPCTAGDECNSTFCYDPAMGPQICSECAVPGDCGVSRDCVMNFGDDYAACVGAGALGDACEGTDQCEPDTFCNTTGGAGVCSECAAAGDCSGGGACFDDTATSGYFICTGGLGDDCGAGTDCNSTFCYDTGFAGMVCSQCAVEADCTSPQVCDYQMGLGYAVCVGTVQNGDACTSDLECESGICDTVCLGALGDGCQDGTECDSGFCYNPPGPGPRWCSMCAGDGDCTSPQVCDFQMELGYAVCG